MESESKILTNSYVINFIYLIHHNWHLVPLFYVGYGIVLVSSARQYFAGSLYHYHVDLFHYFWLNMILTLYARQRSFHSGLKLENVIFLELPFDILL